MVLFGELDNTGLVWVSFSWMHYSCYFNGRGRMQKDQVRIDSTYIAPWALAHEEVPVHILIDPSSEFDSIRIALPEDVSIQDYFNIEEYRETDSEVVVTQLATPNFFGFTVVRNELFETSHLSNEIIIEFLRDEVPVGGKVMTANFYRPTVSLIKAPLSITLQDDSDLNDLIHVKARLKGFGDVTVRVEHRIGEKFKFEMDSLFRELVKRIILASVRREEPDDSDDDSADIDVGFIVEKAARHWDSILSSPGYSTEAPVLLSEFKKWMENPELQKEVKDIIYSQIEDIVISSIQSYSRRFPNERVDIGYGEPTVRVAKVADAVQMRVRYWDSMSNEYEAIQFEIDIHDKRTKKEPTELRVNIEWIVEPYDLSRGCS